MKIFGIPTETLRIEKSICVLTFGKNARVEVRVRGLLSLGADFYPVLNLWEVKTSPKIRRNRATPSQS